MKGMSKENKYEFMLKDKASAVLKCITETHKTGGDWDKWVKYNLSFVNTMLETPHPASPTIDTYLAKGEARRTGFMLEVKTRGKPYYFDLILYGFNYKAQRITIAETTTCAERPNMIMNIKPNGALDDALTSLLYWLEAKESDHQQKETEAA